ncbi:hypothetical protein ACLB2K_025386 [Fragaria x ananassa]
MLVIRKVPSSEDDLCVKVFKLLSDFDGGLKWVEIKTIGNDALFLDRNQCICVVSALEFPVSSKFYILSRWYVRLDKLDKMDRRYNPIPTLSAVWISPTMCFEDRLLPTTYEGAAAGVVNLYRKGMQNRKRLATI